MRFLRGLSHCQYKKVVCKMYCMLISGLIEIYIIITIHSEIVFLSWQQQKTNQKLTQESGIKETSESYQENCDFESRDEF